MIYRNKAELYSPYEILGENAAPSSKKDAEKVKNVTISTPYLQYKKSSLLHEFRLLKRIADLVKSDLICCLEYLKGSINHRKKDTINNTLKSIFDGKIPESWFKAIKNYNFSPKEDGIEGFLKTMTRKFDYIKYKVVGLEGKVEPVIGLGSLIDPGCWIMNAVMFNCLKYNVSKTSKSKFNFRRNPF